MTPGPVTEQQIVEAMARVRARWDHPPVDARDVFERAAVRLGDRGPDVLALQTRCACRLFLRRGEGSPWTSRYVHALDEVDAALDELLERLGAQRRAA